MSERTRRLPAHLQPFGISFEIRTDRAGDTGFMRLSGEFDLGRRAQFEEELGRLRREKPSAVVIDLSEVTFIDSTGIQLILEADSLSREHGFELSFIAGNRQVQRVFDTTGLEQVISTRRA